MIYSPHHSSSLSSFYRMADLKSPRRRAAATSRRRALMVDTTSATDDSVSSVSEPMAQGTCGHDNCGTDCNVRYVGPVSHVNDHHIIRTAHAASHIWAAAVISGLAVVLTGTVAFTSVQAESNKVAVAQKAVAASRADVEQVLNRLNQLDRQMFTLKQACAPETVTTTTRLPQAGKRPKAPIAPPADLPLEQTP